MHALADERLPKYFRVLISREHEDLINVMFPNDGVAVTRERQSALLAKLPQRVELLPGAFLFRQHDPVGTIYGRAAEESSGTYSPIARIPSSMINLTCDP